MITELDKQFIEAVKGSEFVIWGCGKCGIRLERFLTELAGNDSVTYFVNGDGRYKERECNGIPVVSWDEFLMNHGHNTVLIVSEEKSEESIEQIKRDMKSNFVYDMHQYAGEVPSYYLEKQIDKFRQEYQVIEQAAPYHVPEVYRSFKEQGFKVVDYAIDEKDYQEWLTRVDYDHTYPKYRKEFAGDTIYKKMNQHYISYKLLQFSENDVYMDVASSNSVFPDILEKDFLDMTVYRQDMRYKTGVVDKMIGSWASDIPVEDSSIDKVGLHCSLEHFEDGEDFRFLEEAYRILRSHGRVCIIPLYMCDEYVITTSPCCWYNKYWFADSEYPRLDKRAKIFFNDSIKQRQSKTFNVDILKEEVLEKFQDKFDISIVYITNWEQIKGCRPFCLLMEKL